MMYNWDDLEVDDSVDHNSRYFFSKRRSKHEKVDGIFKQEEDDFITEQISGIALLEVTETIKEEARLASIKKEKPSSEKEVLSQNLPSNIKNENMEDLQESAQPTNSQELPSTDEPPINKKQTQLTQQDNQNQNMLSPIMEGENKENGLESKNQNIPMNLCTPSRFGKSATGAIPKRPATNVAATHRLTTKSTKREQLLQKQIEEEQKMREFHSRPMPKFKTPVIQQVHRITVPFTPEVLKRSKAIQQKRLEKVKELEQKYKPIPFKAQEALAVKEAPFVPKHEPLVLQTRPYNLRSDRRLQERKKYDEAIQRNMEEKQKQEEEERKRLEEERLKEIRKATVFKARPNPFNGKNSK